MNGELKILLLAGEESGLVYAERLKSALERMTGRSILFRGYQSEGFATGDLAVMGFGAVLRRLPYFLGVRRTMKSLIRDWRPDAVVTVDYPGLNLKLAAYAKSLGIPAVHLVCPQVWAWHKGRIPKIAASLTKLLCFFPFEPSLFDGTGLDARFIGHPMLDVFEAEERLSGGGDGRGGLPVLAVLPGSRMDEIRRILPRLLLALPRIASAVTEFRVVIPAANGKVRTEIERLVSKTALHPVAVDVVDGNAREVLRMARCAAVASGTATLEAALARCPTVLVYAVSPWLAWFARRVIKEISHIGIANVVWEKRRRAEGGDAAPMPELLQEDFTEDSVAKVLVSWMSDPVARENAAARLDETRELLRSDGNAFDCAAREVMSLLPHGGRDAH